MSTRGKRNARGPPPQGERPRKRGRTTNADNRGEESLEAQMREKYPRQDCRETRRIIADFGEPTPEGWTDSDEETVTEWWDESETKKEIGRLKKEKQQDLLRLWKASFRLFQTSPLWITCLPDGIQYQPSLTHDRTYFALYSKKFCASLLQLMVHPFWDGSIHKLRCALKFAVACRVKDHKLMSYVDMPKGRFCRALDFLNYMLKDDDDYSMHELHDLARKDAIKNGQSPSSWSDFLFHVGETAENKSTRRPPVQEEFLTEHNISTVPLTVWDVDVLIEAIDTMSKKYPKLKCCSTEHALRAWNNSSNGRDIPQFGQLSELYQSFTKEIYRKMIDLIKNAGDDERISGAVTFSVNEDDQDGPPASSDEEDDQDHPPASSNKEDDQEDPFAPSDQEDDQDDLFDLPKKGDDQGERPETPGNEDRSILDGDGSFVPDLDNPQGSADADSQIDSHYILHHEGLEDLDTSMMSRSRGNLWRGIPPSDAFLLPRSPPYMRPRVPTLHELTTRGNDRSTARLEREIKELRNALSHTQEEVRDLRGLCEQSEEKVLESEEVLEQSQRQFRELREFREQTRKEFHELQEFREQTQREFRELQQLREKSQKEFEKFQTERHDQAEETSNLKGLFKALDGKVDKNFQDVERRVTRRREKHVQLEDRLKSLETNVAEQEVEPSRLRDTATKSGELNSNLVRPETGQVAPQKSREAEVEHQKPREPEKEGTPAQAPGINIQQDEPLVQKTLPAGYIVAPIEPYSLEGHDLGEEESSQLPEPIPATGAACEVIRFKIPRVSHTLPLPLAKGSFLAQPGDSRITYMRTLESK